MHLIVGLGNPGTKYKKTRHNAGFMVIDALAGAIAPTSTAKESKRLKALIHKVRYSRAKGDTEVLLVKPQTYMNLSGTAVSLVARFYKIHSRNIWVIHDDLAIHLGTIRIRSDGSSGGHNGVQSIMNDLNTSLFTRFRIGIGPLPPIGAAEDFVLGTFTKSETPLIQEQISRATEALLFAIEYGIEKATNTFSS